MLFRLDGDAHLAFIRVRDGISREIHDYLFDCSRVAPGDALQRRLHVYLEVFLARQVSELLYDVPRDIAHVDVGEGHPLRLNKRVERKEVVDDVRNAVKLLQVASVDGARMRRHIAIEHAHLGIGPDDCKRRAQFVRDIADELFLSSKRVACRRDRYARDYESEYRGDAAYKYGKAHNFPRANRLEVFGHRRPGDRRRGSGKRGLKCGCETVYDIEVQNVQRADGEQQNENGEADLERDDVDLRSEEKIAAVFTREADNRRREPSPERFRLLCRRVFSEDF